MAERDCPQHGYEKQGFRTDILHKHRSSDGVEYSHNHKGGHDIHVHVNKGKLDRMMAE